MEFDVDFLAYTSERALTYGLVMSGGLLLIISLISYLSMSRASEPYFKKLAYTDFLTGYENRMAFEQRLRECGDLANNGERVTLLICDVNNLKVINDTQGHKVGDTYIKNTADIIMQHLKNEGEQSLYRIGGDEFAGIIVGKDENSIRKMMTAIRYEIRPAIKGQPFSCACGAATFTPGVDITLRDVFKRADDAMYKEKRRQKAAQAEAAQQNM
jgi:diguanylate cyclase (GGDEF)-like protein